MNPTMQGPDIAAMHARGLTALKARDLIQAERWLAEARKHAPSSPEIANDLGLVLSLRGKPAEAVPHLREALKRKPDMVGAHLNLGNAYVALSHLAGAEAHFRIAIGYSPDLIAAHVNLADVLATQGRVIEAEQVARSAVALNPEFPIAHLRLAKALTNQGRKDEAVAAFDKAQSLDPTNLGIQLAKARALAGFGEIEDAIAEHKAILKSQPGHIGSLVHLAKLQRFSGADDAEKVQLSREIAERAHNMAEDEVERSELLFAHAKILEDRSQYAEAMSALIVANQLRRKSIEYEPKHSEAAFRDIETAFSAQAMERHTGAGNPDPTPVFVVGMPRSGTTLTESILATHPQVQGIGEVSILMALEARWRGELEAKTRAEAVERSTPEYLKELGEAYVRQVRKYSLDAQFIVDKMPANILHLGFIRLILPHAKIIHCRRNPADNALSIFKQSFNRNAQGFSYDMGELGHYYRLYQGLSAHWHELFDGWIFDSAYEDLVTDKVGQTARLFAFLGLEAPDEQADHRKGAAPVLTASVAQVREEVHTRSVGLAAKYGSGIQPLLDALSGQKA